jgi:hypothetical protein
VYLQDDNDDVEVRGARVLRIKDTIVAPLASSQTANDSPGQSNPEQPNPEQDSPPSDGYIVTRGSAEGSPTPPPT